MEPASLQFGSETALHILSNEVFIHSTQDALDLMGEFSADAYILHDYNFEKDFFDLSSRKLGDVLQKFTNYRVRLAIIGDFSNYPSKVLPSFISESNRQRNYIFVSSIEDVKSFWGEFSSDKIGR